MRVKAIIFLFSTFGMSLEKIKYWRQRKAELLDEQIRARYGRPNPNHSPQSAAQTIPKFKRVLSSSQVSQTSQRQLLLNRQKKSFSNMKLYKKLNHKLDQIKETIKQSLVTVGQRRQKSNAKRKERVVTEISEQEPRRNGQKKNHYDILEHIAEVRAKNRTQQDSLAESREKSVPKESERTLFYGIDFIDSVQFKIKLKLSKTNYYLFAKNNHTKIMVEMTYADYMKLHLGELRGNPCNIFRFLAINEGKIQLKLRGQQGKALAPSLKSYVGYY